MKQDFRKWASRQICANPQPWPLWARLLAWITIVALCGIIAYRMQNGL